METIDAGKLPKNIEAEQALIGAILQNNKSLEKILCYGFALFH